MKLFYSVVAASACLALSAPAADAQSGVINPLYSFGEEKLCLKTSRADTKAGSSNATAAHASQQKPKANKPPNKAELEKCSAAKHPGSSKIDYRDVLVYLLGEYPIVPRNREEYGRSSPQLLERRLTPDFQRLTAQLSKAASRSSNAVETVNIGQSSSKLKPLNFRDASRFDGDAVALNFRRSLLRLFEAAYTGGVDAYFVRPNLEPNKNLFGSLAVSIASRPELAGTGCTTKPTENACWEAFMKVYRPLRNPVDDDVVIRAFLRGDDPFYVVFAPNDPDQSPFPTTADGSKVFADRDEVSAPWIQPTRRFFANAGEQSGTSKREIDGVSYNRRTSRRLKLVKDAGEFSKDDADDAAFGLVVNLNDDSDASTVNVDAALGYSFMRTWTLSPTEIEHASVAPKSLTFTPYVSFSQSPGKIVVPDPEREDGPDGPATTETTFASGTLFAGVRAEYELFGRRLGLVSPKKLAEAAEALATEGNTDPLALSKWGRYSPGHKFSITSGAFTDNYFDQQGYQVAGGWSPDFRGNVWGYRNWTRLSFGEADNLSSRGNLEYVDWFRSGYFRWDAEFVVDHIWYGRAPNETTTLLATDRLTSADATRLGVDADLKLQWKNMFSPPSDDSRFELGVEYQFRESLKDNSRTLQNTTFTAGITDVLSENYSLTFEYEVGRDILTQDETDTFTFNLGLGF